LYTFHLMHVAENQVYGRNLSDMHLNDIRTIYLGVSKFI